MLPLQGCKGLWPRKAARSGPSPAWLLWALIALSACSAPGSLPSREAVEGEASDSPSHAEIDGGEALDLGPAVSGPRAGLRLGEGDLIRMTMFNFPEMETTAYVDAEGRVRLPLIGAVQIGGLSPGEAEQWVSDAYRNARFFRDPQVNILLQQYRSAMVTVLGHVNRPGRYPLETALTVHDAVALAEGARPTADWLVTVIRRNEGGVSREQVSLEPRSGDGDEASLMALQAGDIIHIPEARRFYIDGEVNAPNEYPMRPGLTIAQAISLGGGVTRRGSYSRILIRRPHAGGGLETIRAALADRIHPNDVIVVRGSFF
jgi:polysaccharide export outer membrane protein